MRKAPTVNNVWHTFEERSAGVAAAVAEPLHSARSAYQVGKCGRGNETPKRLACYRSWELCNQPFISLSGFLCPRRIEERHRLLQVQAHCATHSCTLSWTEFLLHPTMERGPMTSHVHLTHDGH